jgi:hypothetical protein
VSESRSAANQLLLTEPAEDSSFFPESNEVPGWVKSGEVRTFEAADLWKYVDGDAERYLRAGVQRTLSAEYRFRDQLDAVVDIHAMGTSAGVMSISESEPGGGSHSIPLGDARSSIMMALFSVASLPAIQMCVS